MCKLVRPFHTGTTEITRYLLFLFENGLTVTESLWDDNMFSLSTISLRDTVDNGYLEMFFLTWAMVWEGNLHLSEGWLCTNAVILRHRAALFLWGSCSLESLMGLLTAWAKVCSSFDREVTYLPRPYGHNCWHSILLCYTFPHGECHGGVLAFSLAIP